ncbi:MAG TPA: sulfotransferase [Solirubrobacteraceae bacterium]|nr:sulfotransferase [Solirubrobacteraceae bacterium]
MTGSAERIAEAAELVGEAPREPVAQGNRTAGRAPDFFIVGHPKCGTTALYEMLRGHPQIYMPDLKEPQFFAAELQAGGVPYPGELPRTLEQYLALFAPAAPGQRAGEASPSYLRSQTAAQRIAELAPDARIVAILREPASFLRSLHLQFVQAVIESEFDFATALALEHDRRAGRRRDPHSYWPQALLYSEHVRYVEQLRRFHAVFPREQVLVLIYDDFRADNNGTVRQVLRFLGVDEDAPIAPAEANPTVSARSPVLHDLMHTLAVGRGPASRSLKAALKALTPDDLRRGALRALRSRVIYAEPPAPDEDLMRELRRRYRGEVAALSEYLGRDLLGLWDYGDAG